MTERRANRRLQRTAASGLAAADAHSLGVLAMSPVIRTLLVACIFASHLAHGADLVPPPKGFTWLRLPEIRSAILKPEGWVFSSSSHHGNPQFALTAPSRKPGELSLPQFQLTFIKGTKPRDDPDKLARDFIEGMSRTFTALETWETSGGPFAGRAGFFLDSKGVAPAHKSFSQMLVNRKTGSVFILGFEAQESAWEERWTGAGQTICRVFLLEDEL